MRVQHLKKMHSLEELAGDVELGGGAQQKSQAMQVKSLLVYENSAPLCDQRQWDWGGPSEVLAVRHKL